MLFENKNHEKITIKKNDEARRDKGLSDAARAARNEASRIWRANNREKVQEYNRRYWERKAEREAAKNGKK